MSLSEKLGLAALLRLDPERAHSLSIIALRAGLVPAPGPFTTARLKTRLAGIELPNPIGLAAGFDKNATVIKPLLRAGFGFVEVGAATPRPQPGSPRPRLFRLRQDRAAINRFGFNNDGADAIAQRLKNRPERGIVGLNLGANKDSDERALDYIRVLETCGPLVDFVTVNVSSPNTADLRELQSGANLRALLNGVLAARRQLGSAPKVFLKIAPDLSDRQIADIAEIAIQTGIDGIIATNTTLSRATVTSPLKSEPGGLSGAPLFTPSTRVLGRLAHLTNGAIPLIGVGGISNADEAYSKIKAGATAVQLYTALVFRGLSLVREIATGLDALAARDGLDNLSEAVGVESGAYA